MQDKEREVVCITGSTGFVGRYIAKELCSRGLKVRCVVRPTSDLTPLAGLPVEICRGDVTDMTSLEKALQNVGTVVHLVAIIRETKGATFEAINLSGTKNLVQAAKRIGVKRLVYMSNLGTGPDKRFPLLYTKWRAEEEVRNSGIGFVILRPSVMFGRGDGFVTVLTGIIKRTPLVPVIGSGKARFQLISVEDVATCVAELLTDNRTVNQIIPLGGPEYLTYEEIIDLIIKKLKLRRRKMHIPVPLMHFVVWTGEKLGVTLPVTSAQLAMLTRDNITSLDAVEKLFGFKPVSLREKIDDIVS
jgi:NADH dehydrogenase